MIKIFQDIPEDKVVIVIEMFKALRALYAQSGVTAVKNEIAPNAKGIFNKYANPSLVPSEFIQDERY